MRDDAPVHLPDPHSHIPFPAAGEALYAAAWGEGRPLVFVHGGLADHRAALWRAAPLIERLRLITPDLRGCGRSVSRSAQTWDRLGDDLAALLDHLGLERAVIGGVSAGCAVSLNFALRHPDRVAGLVLVTPAHGGAGIAPTEAQRHGFDAMHRHAQRAVEVGIEALLPLYAPLPEPVRGLAQRMAAGFDPRSIVRHTALLASGDAPFANAAALTRIDRPALLIPGADGFHPTAVADAIARHLPDCAQHPSDGHGFADAVLGLVHRARWPAHQGQCTRSGTLA